MIDKLAKLADHLDKRGLYKEADYVDWIIKKEAKKALPYIFKLIDEVFTESGDEISMKNLVDNFKAGRDSLTGAGPFSGHSQQEFYNFIIGSREGMLQLKHDRPLRESDHKDALYKFSYDYIMEHIDELEDVVTKTLMAKAAALFLKHLNKRDMTL